MRRLPLRAIILGALFCVVFAYLAAVGSNRLGRIGLNIAVTQISSLSILFSLALVVLLNPLLRLVRLHPMDRREIFIVFIMTTVPAGIPLFGYVSQVVPMIGGFNHPEWNTPQSQWDEKVKPIVDNRLFVHDEPDTEGDEDEVKPVERYVSGMRAVGGQSFPVFVKRDGEEFDSWFDRIAACVRGGPDRPALWGDIPWSAWAVPLLYWAAIGVVCWILLYCLNELLFKQWYEHEKLVFPIAEMSAILLGAEDEGGGRPAPHIFRNPVFWLGFAIAFGFLFYNGMVTARWIVGPNVINLEGQTIALLLRESPFKAALGGPARLQFEIFFLVVGLAFLLPAEISFSAWFFFVILKVQLLLAVWLGYGVDGGSFPSGWFQESSFMTAQGGGAMWCFGLVCLWKVRRQLVAWLYRLARPKGTETFPEEEVKRLTVPSLLFFLMTVLVFAFLRHGNVGWGMAAVVYLGILFMTVAMVRLVTESGIIAFQLHFSPMHVMKMFGLLRFKTLFAVKGIGTVILFLSGMFSDVKAYIAPTMMNAKYLAAKNRISGRLFVFAVALSIAIVTTAATVVVLSLVYDQGVGSMNNWFFERWPQRVYKSITNIQNNVGDWKEANETIVSWTFVGAGVCGLLVYLRQSMFWVPHPIGLVMFVNPLMRSYWFSIFIAWLCKRAAVKYCNPSQYKYVRGLFWRRATC